MWTLEAYCANQEVADWTSLPPSSQSFLKELDLPSVHPFCEDDAPPFIVDGIPPMGPLQNRFGDHQGPLDVLYTVWRMVAPAMLAMSELWFRLFAGVLAPIGITYFIHQELKQRRTTTNNVATNRINWTDTKLGLICVVTVASSLVLMTDALYVLEYEPHYGISLFVTSTIFSFRVCLRNNLVRTSLFLVSLVLLSIHLIWDYETNSLSFGNYVDEVRIEEGLYYDSRNDFIHRMVQDHWPEKYRTYNSQKEVDAATPWMVTGDSRTGLPFLLNNVPNPNYIRVFLPTLVDDEVLALDIAFPEGEGGHDSSKPMYLVLHGLNGGSNKVYIRDFTLRRISEGSTVVVMIARGLMDLPIRGWDIFHCERTIDVHAAALALRKVKSPNQILFGLGYSTGGIVISNYVSSYGSDCVLDGAMAISAALDMRYQEHFYRAQRLWQPILAEEMRDVFLLGKWGERVHRRLTTNEMKLLMRASDISEIDKLAVVAYHGFRDLNHYYSDMSALGDIQRKTIISPKTDGSQHNKEITILEENNKGKIHNVSIPFCVVHSLDDPLLSWRTIASSEGFMNPSTLVKSGKGNMLLLLTKRGGHVGWPLGYFPFTNKWKWMSDVAMSFATAVHEIKMITSQEATTATITRTISEKTEATTATETTTTVTGTVEV